MQKSSTLSHKSWDWSSAILLFILIQVAASRLVITDWTPFLFFTQTLSAFSVVLGLLLGYSKFRPHTVRWLAFFYSLVILPWQLTAAEEVQAPFAERLAMVGGRLWYSLVEFFNRKPVEDGLFFVALVSLGFWIIGLTAGYAQTRHNNTLVALVPAGVATLIVQIYDSYAPTRIWILAFYVFLSLVYLGRIYLRQNREAWSDQRVMVTAESTQDIGRSLLAVAAVIVFLAWSLPTSISELKGAARSWDRFARPIRDRLTNAVSSLDSPYAVNGQGDFYGESLMLGQNAAVGDTQVFTVRLNTQMQNQPPRFYWRGRTYDTYSNGRWTNTGLISRDFQPRDEPLSLSFSEGGHEEATFIFALKLPRQSLLYAPADPIWVNRPGQFYSTLTPGRGEDLSSWIADPALSAGDKYQVRAWIANPTVEELQSAGTDYPAWVKQRYIQVVRADDATMNEFAQLALQVTDGKESPYDKTQAITQYLRNEIQYSTTVVAPPKGVDPTLWVLKDYRKGFCMYYASAEVLMLRSIGIPARLAVGFAQGKLDKDINTYSVLRQDAHAWPEVFFPGIGWVEFEPTGNQDPLVRPVAPAVVPTPGDNTGGVDGGLLNPQNPFERESRLNDEGVTNLPPDQGPANPLLGIGLGLLFVGVLLAADQRFGFFGRLPAFLSRSYARNGVAVPAWVTNWESWMGLGPIERSFHAINYSLDSLGKPQPRHVSPVQRAAVLKDLLPAAHDDIEILLQEHQASMYTAQPGNPSRARAAAWKLIGRTLWARLAKAWDDFDSRFNRYG